MPDKSYPEGVTEMDHVNHDMKMGRFPNQSSVETFLKERATLAAQEGVAHLPSGQSKSDASDLMQSDLRELLLILEMGDHARPQSPHEVFQEALTVLRQRLRGMDNHASDCALNNAPALPVRPCSCGADPLGGSGRPRWQNDFRYSD